MSDKSNNQGRAYEYACLNSLYSAIKEYRDVSIVHNSSFEAAQRAWETLSDTQQAIYKNSSNSIVYKIFEIEPCIIEIDDNDDILELLIQPDTKGKEGDVRDILVIRKNIDWEIGFSIKHNHFAVKHSRISHNLDFGKEWYNIPCSQNYWDAVRATFEYLISEKQKKTRFSDLPDKECKIYAPILKAFIQEITFQEQRGKGITKKLTEYLLGKYDFYKIVSIDHERITQIQSYNIHGTLNQSSKSTRAKILIPTTLLPTRIIHFDFVPGRLNTIELYMNHGWQFSFRIHNAETYVVPSLKFDIQIIGMPTTIITIKCNW